MLKSTRTCLKFERIFFNIFKINPIFLIDKSEILKINPIFLINPTENNILYILIRFSYFFKKPYIFILNKKKIGFSAFIRKISIYFFS